MTMVDIIGGLMTLFKFLNIDLVAVQMSVLNYEECLVGPVGGSRHCQDYTD